MKVVCTKKNECVNINDGMYHENKKKMPKRNSTESQLNKNKIVTFIAHKSFMSDLMGVFIVIKTM